MPQSNAPGVRFKALSIHHNAVFYPPLNQNFKEEIVYSLGIKALVKP